MNKFVVCEFEWIDNHVVLHQKGMVESLGVKFSGNIDKKYDKVPTSPYMIFESVGDEDPILYDCIQKRYQQGVGSLM